MKAVSLFKPKGNRGHVEGESTEVQITQKYKRKRKPCQ